jgi:hypothetical protein
VRERVKEKGAVKNLAIFYMMLVIDDAMHAHFELAKERKWGGGRKKEEKRGKEGYRYS